MKDRRVSVAYKVWELAWCRQDSRTLTGCRGYKENRKARKGWQRGVAHKGPAGADGKPRGPMEGLPAQMALREAHPV